MTDPQKPWSLRRRLTVRVLGVVMAGWLVTVAVSARLMEYELNEMFDEELQALVETTILYLDASETEAIPRQLGVTTNDGERVLRILSAVGPEPKAPWPPLLRDGYHDAPGWRILRRQNEGAVIEAAHTTAWRRSEVLEASSALLVLSLPLILVLLWGVRRITTAATDPVSALAFSVAARRPDDLSPIVAASLPRELQPMAASFNVYLQRIEDLRKSERDFVANAAHELRTPLATIRARLELSSDGDAAAAVAGIDGLTRRVDRLLQLARLESGVALGRGPTDVLRVLQLLTQELTPRSRHGLRLDDGDLDRLMVAADADALAILLRNLIENAIDHGTGEVWLRLRTDGRLVIENPTTGTALIEERFARGPNSDGAGLGLSIIAALARAMSIRIVADVKDGLARTELTLPMA